MVERVNEKQSELNRRQRRAIMFPPRKHNNRKSNSSRWYQPIQNGVNAFGVIKWKYIQHTA